MGENSKAMDRREREGFFNFTRGRGIDIGAGDYPLLIPECGAAQIEPWDTILGNGDATYMEGVKDETYDFVFSSHCLEHLSLAHIALRNWWRITKRGGFIIIAIPHRDLYEKKNQLPSKWNGDHKHFWLLDRNEPPCTFGILPLIRQELPESEIVRAKVQSSGHTINDPDKHSDGEYSIEIILRKP